MFLKKGYSAVFAVALIVLAAATDFPPPALAKQIKGKKAAAYVNDKNGALAQGGYHSLVLRSYDRDPVTNSYIDALVYSPYAKAVIIARDNGYHRLRFSAERGRPMPPVTPDTYASFEKTIRREHLQPQIVLDREGNELCIIYSAQLRYSVNYRREANGEAVLEFETGRHKQHDRDQFFTVPPGRPRH